MTTKEALVLKELPVTRGSAEGPTVDGASPRLLRRLLRTLEAELALQGVPVDQYLKPGASAEQVRQAFEQCGLSAPGEAVTWFGWHNGPTGVGNSVKVLPMFQLWSLDRCVREYLDPHGQPKGHGPRLWNPEWIQLMGDGNGLAIHCGGSHADPPLVRSLSVGRDFGTQDGQVSRQAVSLCTPVAWWIDCLRRGWYVWNREATAWELDDPNKQGVIRASHQLS